MARAGIVTGGTAFCYVPCCGWSQWWPSEEAARSLAVWHVYEEHREIWEVIAAGRPPLDPDPRIAS